MGAGQPAFERKIVIIRQRALVGYTDIALGKQRLYPKVLRYVREQPQSQIQFAIAKLYQHGVPTGLADGQVQVRR